MNKAELILENDHVEPGAILQGSASAGAWMPFHMMVSGWAYSGARRVSGMLTKDGEGT